MTLLPKISRKRGFTLLELLVAMGVTTALILVLVGMTGVAIDAWRQSRDDIRGSRIGRTALEVVGRDFQSLVRPSGNVNEWLTARIEPNIQGGNALGGPTGAEIPNAVQMIFFSAPTDRYEGDVLNNPGDVSAISYRLVYRDPVLDADPGAANAIPTFALYRQLVNPDQAFQDLYQVPDLLGAYEGTYGANDLTSQNFLVENIYEFTIVFQIEHLQPDGTTRRNFIPISISPQNTYSQFRVYGDRIQTVPALPEIESGRIVGVSISITVLTDEGVTLAREGGIDQQTLVERFSYRYSRSVITPGS